MRSKKMTFYILAAAVFLVLAGSMLLRAKPLIPPNAISINISGVIHFDENGNEEVITLTREQEADIAALLKEQECGFMLDSKPLPIDPKDYVWEITYGFGEHTFHMDLGEKDFVYKNPDKVGTYRLLADGNGLTKALNDLLLQTP